VQIRLPFRPPFRWNAIATFLGDRAIAGIESFDGIRYVRGPVMIEVWDRHSCLSMTGGIDGDIVRARRMFDLDADPMAIDEHLRKDKLLRPLLKKRPGPRVPGAWEPFEVAVRAIVGQQITVRATTTIMNRCFVTSEWSGMPKSRINAIRALDPSILARGATLDETIERLTSLPGVGPWTAHYIAMRALGESDAFPHTDLGLRKAAAAIGIDPGKLLARAERWRPWRAYAAIALWESL
jgi:AraC family transcriptional regulator of adaptative response / DNA-3-methyladenine glycosylase II